MGLAYFSIFVVILGAAGIAVVLLKAAWEIWKKDYMYRIKNITEVWL